MLAFGDLAKYGAIMAKVRAMSSEMLDEEDYRRLINCKSVPQAAAFLKNETAYGKYLKDINEGTVHRNELERLMNNAYNDDVIKLYRFDNGENKRFYTYVFIKAEIEWLKLVLRRLVNENNLGDDLLLEIPPFFKKRFTINTDRLVKSQSIRGFLENLGGSRYENVITPLITLKEHQNLFSVEMTLDMYYYSMVEKLRKGLRDPQDREIVDKNVGSEVDMLNLLWIYRCKKYFQTPSELIYAYIIPNKHRLRKKDIVNLVEARTPEEFLGFLENTPYRGLFLQDDERFHEQIHATFVYKMHEKAMRVYPYSIEAVLSHLHLKAAEIKNIISVIEGIRYGLPPDEIKPYIVGFKI